MEQLIKIDDRLIEILQTPKTIENSNERLKLIKNREVLIKDYREKRSYVNVYEAEETTVRLVEFDNIEEAKVHGERYRHLIETIEIIRF